MILYDFCRQLTLRLDIRTNNRYLKIKTHYIHKKISIEYKMVWAPPYCDVLPIQINNKIRYMQHFWGQIFKI